MLEYESYIKSLYEKKIEAEEEKKLEVAERYRKEIEEYVNLSQTRVITLLKEMLSTKFNKAKYRVG